MRPIDANALVAEQCGQCDGACEMCDEEKCLSCKADCHCDLREAIDNAPTLDLTPKWISVKDGVPPERIDKPGSERCFVYGVTPEGKKVIAISRYYSGEWVLLGELESENVTHWMPNPNPQPPKEG